MTIELSVTGMTCGGCAKSVERALRGVAGVAQVTVDLAGGSATVQPAPGEAAPVPSDLISALDNAGFGAALASPAGQ